jgi:hypothetical protein
MTGGDLHWIWKPYALYAQVDYVCERSIVNLNRVMDPLPLDVRVAFV